VCQSGLALNLDMAATAFLASGPLAQLAAHLVGMPGPEGFRQGLRPPQARALREALRGVRVTVEREGQSFRKMVRGLSEMGGELWLVGGGCDVLDPSSRVERAATEKQPLAQAPTTASRPSQPSSPPPAATALIPPPPPKQKNQNSRPHHVPPRGPQRRRPPGRLRRRLLPDPLRRAFAPPLPPLRRRQRRPHPPRLAAHGSVPRRSWPTPPRARRPPDRRHALLRGAAPQRPPRLPHRRPQPPGDAVPPARPDRQGFWGRSRGGASDCRRPRLACSSPRVRLARLRRPWAARQLEPARRALPWRVQDRVVGGVLLDAAAGW
jgi:hypothetical protein